MYGQIRINSWTIGMNAWPIRMNVWVQIRMNVWTDWNECMDRLE